MRKRLATGGKKKAWRKKRKLDTGNHWWGSEAVTRKTRILDVVYNASNSKLVRTQTLLKRAIDQVDAALFKQWYLQHYGLDIGRKSSSSQERRRGINYVMIALILFPLLFSFNVSEGETGTEEAKKSNGIEDQLLACISSRPGQCGHTDGYVMSREYFFDKELEFYMKKIQRKKGKGAA
ncbi:hypothetical protein Goshw_027393 [Gossypium schwendimanii]|uniref:40S ribosomal protein S8 n=1 Tax=Gossypium schwendimanii TaxID=34291 RepID=A0A7J9MXY6_GOSSC|nr:hypothetical protein [Gossypium schwendimanii]